MTGDSSPASTLEWRNIDYRYPQSTATILQGCSARLKTGIITALVGRTAVGKSTLGMLVKGLLEPVAGEFRLAKGVEMQSLSSAERMRLAGWACAHPEIQIFAPTVREEVEFGLRRQGFSGERLRERIEGALDAVGISLTAHGGLNPLVLSGGWRRLVALASLAAMDYRWYVFDEPTAGLDLPGMQRVCGLMRKRTADGCGVLWITHDLAAVRRGADRLWLMEEGRITLDLCIANVKWQDLNHRMAGTPP